jgi:hypothetical protein
MAVGKVVHKAQDQNDGDNELHNPRRVAGGLDGSLVEHSDRVLVWIGGRLLLLLGKVEAYLAVAEADPWKLLEEIGLDSPLNFFFSSAFDDLPPGSLGTPIYPPPALG